MTLVCGWTAAGTKRMEVQPLKIVTDKSKLFRPYCEYELTYEVQGREHVLRVWASPASQNKLIQTSTGSELVGTYDEAAEFLDWIML